MSKEQRDSFLRPFPPPANPSPQHTKHSPGRGGGAGPWLNSGLSSGQTKSKIPPKMPQT